LICSIANLNAGLSSTKAASAPIRTVWFSVMLWIIGIGKAG
jgi:hypothetical protein